MFDFLQEETLIDKNMGGLSDDHRIFFGNFDERIRQIFCLGGSQSVSVELPLFGYTRHDAGDSAFSKGTRKEKTAFPVCLGNPVE